MESVYVYRLTPQGSPSFVCVKGRTEDPQVVVRLIFIVANPTRSFLRPVDQVLQVAICKIVSATETLLMSLIGLAQQYVFSMIGDNLVGGGVEQGRRMMALVEQKSVVLIACLLIRRRHRLLKSSTNRSNRQETEGFNGIKDVNKRPNSTKHQNEFLGQ